jgi:hypothetical protein
MANPTFEIPKDIINPIIQASVNEAVLRALDGPQNLVTGAILGMLNTKVDESGRPCNYSGSKPWIDWVIGDCVKQAARAAIEQHLESHKDELRAQLAAQLQKKNSPLVKQLVEGMVNAVTSERVLKYGISVSYGND